MPNHATKADLKNAIRTEKSTLAAKSDWASLNNEIHKLDIKYQVLAA